MSLEKALEANTAAITALVEVWGKLATMGKQVANNVEAGTQTTVTAGNITIPLVKEAKAETKKPVVSAATPTTPAPATETVSQSGSAEKTPPSDTSAPDYPAVKAAMLRAIKIHGNAPVIALLAETGVEKAQLLTPEQYPAFIAQCDALAATPVSVE